MTGIILFAAFLYMLMIYYLQTTSKLDQQSYDMSTITAGDFTVEMDITAKMWQFFLDNHYEAEGATDEYDGSTLLPAALQLKNHLSHKMTAMISKSMHARLHDCHDEEEKKDENDPLARLGNFFQQAKKKKK